MSVPWFTDSANRFNHHSNRVAQSAYVPPYRRDDNEAINASYRCRGGGGGAGGGRRGGRSPGYFRHENRNHSDVSAKLKQLEVKEENDDDDDDSKLNATASHDTPVEASGTDVPPPAKSFSEIGFASRALMENIKRCKYVKPTPIQKYAIPVAMEGRDLMACAQTGSGKTAAFCFPIIDRILVEKKSLGDPARRVACPLALILAPTRELSCQIYEEAKKFSHQTGVKVVVAYGGAPIFHQLRNMEKGVDILVATPGRLVDMIEKHRRVTLKNVKYLTLDEADRMLDMGFEPQVRKIVQQMGMPPPSSRQTLLFSATFPSAIQRLASDFLSKDYIFLAAGKVGSSTDLIVQRVDFVTDMDKRGRLVNLLQAQMKNRTTGKDALTVVFVETKKGADALENWLCRRGFPSIAIHGDKVQMEREQALRSFKNGVTPILVATDVAARGLDISNVAHVINFDLPKVIDDYVHRIGRTGRAGKSGLATAFFSEKNAPLAKDLVELMEDAKQEIPPWLKEYAETTYTASNGRSKRSSGSKFAGYDYRNGDHEEGGNRGVSGDFVKDTAANPSPYSAADTCQFAPYIVPAYSGFSNDSVFVDSNGYGFNQGSVVATGWN